MLLQHQALLREVEEHQRAENELGAVRDNLDTELADMKRLHCLSARLLNETETVPLLRDVLAASMELLGADKGTLQLYEERSKTLKIVAHVGFNEEFLDHFKSVSTGNCVCGLALARGSRVIMEDGFNDERFPEMRSICAAHGFVAAQSTPLHSGDGRLLGMLSTHFCRPHRPSERELRLLLRGVRQSVGKWSAAMRGLAPKLKRWCWRIGKLLAAVAVLGQRQ